jgi:hypothetical protein
MVKMCPNCTLLAKADFDPFVWTDHTGKTTFANRMSGGYQFLDQAWACVPARSPSPLPPFHHAFAVRREGEPVHPEIKPRGCGPPLDTHEPAGSAPDAGRRCAGSPLKFLLCSEIGIYHSDMTDASDLRPATFDEIAETLSFALSYQGRRRVYDADGAMARITAEWLVCHLAASGFMLMKQPARAAPTTSHMPPSSGNA